MYQHSRNIFSTSRIPRMKIRKTDYMLGFAFVWVSSGFGGFQAASSGFQLSILCAIVLKSFCSFCNFGTLSCLVTCLFCELGGKEDISCTHIVGIHIFRSPDCGYGIWGMMKFVLHI